MNTDKLPRSPSVAAYVDFYLSDEGMTTAVAEQVGYIALPADRLEATRSTWESASA